MKAQNTKTALITGGSRRIGKAITMAFHSFGFNVIIHCNKSLNDAASLASSLNAIRPSSAKVIQADLAVVDDMVQLHTFYTEVINAFGGLDILVHNASSFYPSNVKTDLLNATHFDTLHRHWHDLFLTNAKAPLILSQLFYPQLVKNCGSIISILDIHAQGKPFIKHPIYTMAKAAQLAMVQSLALEFAPNVRINGVSPGVNILPEDSPQFDDDFALHMQHSIPLAKIGTPSDIAKAVLFLATTDYITGQVLPVDGGRSLTLPY
ncbi:pteridine reductase [Moraxella nasovis]|uniref:pteridine reductase n=1 Tax=Moraxella nasovis TaxID=2904121 RepID=UPI001F615710|nr:pteridine reductase [Moraxella nasovis]UNU73754.1 pteridine reductase [Moraxella nasovis]